MASSPTHGRCVTRPAHQRGSPGSMPDAEFVARARSGDRAAQEALVARHYDDCSRYALRLLGERADAEDAVQETFMRAMGALPRYLEDQRFRGWLFTILVNQCRNLALARRRREHRFPLLAAGEWRDALGVVAPPPLADDELARALAGLDALQREALLLRFGEAMGYAEVARLTGASPSALKMRVKRGCERLRALLPSDAP